MRILLAAALSFPLGGCIAQTAVDVVTLPVKAVAAGVDATTTTQAEADRERGRQIRRQEECLGREERRARKDVREPEFSRCAPQD